MRLLSRRRGAPARRAACSPGTDGQTPPGAAARPSRPRRKITRSAGSATVAPFVLAAPGRSRDAIRMPQDDLLGARRGADYTEAERKYSASVRAHLEELLQGRQRQMVLLRRDHRAPDRLAAMPAPAGVDRRHLRREVVEQILIATLAFVRDTADGGAIFQALRGDRLIETQHFATRYPHIVIERVDAFNPADRAPLATEWRLRRVQNQRAETHFNRWLDAANLALSAFKTLRGA
jgi:hypothetical protein